MILVGIECAFKSLTDWKEALMNNNQFKGQWKQFKGELKNKWGQSIDGRRSFGS